MARIFLSYSASHHALAERVAISLRGDGHVVFFDRVAIPASADFHGLIRREIRRSHLMVFLVSPSSVRSGSYARAELRIAQREWKSPRYRVVSMMVEPTRYEDIPAFLREVSILDPEGDAVGELTHAVDWVLRRNRRRRLRWASAIVSGTSITAALSVFLYRSLVTDPTQADTLPASAVDPAVQNAAAPAASPRPSPRRAAQPEATTPTRAVELPGGVFLTMRRAPAGRFTMGAEAIEQTDRIAEPLREVTVDAVWVGETEVTQAQWRAVMRSTPGCEAGCGDDYPVTGVSHGDAIAFCNALSERAALGACYQWRDGGWRWPDPDCTGYRLLTEAEWEYVARAGTQARFGFGDDESQACQHGNGRDRARAREVSTSRSHLPCDDGYAELAPVARFTPNPWGLFDLHGNAWEWVWEPSPDRTGRRIIRGGSFLDNGRGLRVANRNHHSADDRFFSIGFRIARSG